MLNIYAEFHAPIEGFKYQISAKYFDCESPQLDNMMLTNYIPAHTLYKLVLVCLEPSTHKKQ